VINESMLGSRFAQAVEYAVAAHRGHVRKGTVIPYVARLLAVCALVLEDGGGEDEAFAALLHDAVEDRGGETRLADIRQTFGSTVADFPLACSDPPVVPKPPWRQWKERQRASIPWKPSAVLRVSLGDQLHNARARCGPRALDLRR
jgi:(p)ppGpp synthase/HD superfamily hydrolase